jgi:hypothetical protein
MILHYLKKELKLFIIDCLINFLIIILIIVLFSLINNGLGVFIPNLLIRSLSLNYKYRIILNNMNLYNFARSPDSINKESLFKAELTDNSPKYKILDEYGAYTHQDFIEEKFDGVYPAFYEIKYQLLLEDSKAHLENVSRLLMEEYINSINEIENMLQF